MDNSIIDTLALTLGAGWAAGLNLYAAVLMLGLAQTFGYVELPAGLELISDPMVLSAAGLMYFVEFFADKIPGVDSGWDGLHTFIRIPAGALMAAGAASGFDINEAAQLAMALLGGGLAAGSHLTKAGGRVLINTSPEPVSNWTASITEDIAVIGGLWAALSHPGVFLALLAIVVLIMAWVIPKLWRAISSLFGKISAFFSGNKDTEREQPEARPKDD